MDLNYRLLIPKLDGLLVKSFQKSLSNFMNTLYFEYFFFFCALIRIENIIF